MKHLATHAIHLKAEACTVFDCLRESVPSTSAGMLDLPEDPDPGTCDGETYPPESEHVETDDKKSILG